MTRIRVLHREDGANDASGFDTPKNTATQPAVSENRQISGSPSGVPSPASLSLRIKTLRQRRTSNRADKEAKSGNYISVRGDALPPKQSPVKCEIASLL